MPQKSGRFGIGTEYNELKNIIPTTRVPSRRMDLNRKNLPLEGSKNTFDELNNIYFCFLNEEAL